MAHVLIIEGWISDSGNLILSILKRMGHTYTFVTRNPSLYKCPNGQEEHQLFRQAVNTIEVDTNNMSDLIDAVKDLKFDGVMTACDYYFDAVRHVADTFGLPCPIPRRLKQVRQKHLMRQALDASNISNAKFQLAYTWEDMIESAKAIGYPLIVKPVDLGSSAFVQLIHNERTLKEAFDALQAFARNYRGQIRNPVILLEEYLEGQEVSVECVVFNNEINVIGITDKSITGAPNFIETGHMFPAKVDVEKEKTITHYVKSALKAVEFENGIAHTEVKLTRKGPILVEINPRVPGNYIVELIEHVTGVNLLNIFVGLSLGVEPELTMKDTGITSAASLFIVPPKEGEIQSVKGLDRLLDAPNLLRYKILESDNRLVPKPTDNACYLGHLITTDSSGYNARQYGEALLSQLTVEYK